MTALTTWEGMPVPFPQSINQQLVAERLMRHTEGGPAPAFRWKRGRLYAGEMAGCIQVGSIRINVLPKTDTTESERDREFLLNLLHHAGYLNHPHTSGLADVRASPRDPLEVVIAEVASEMTSALREGIPRRYEERHEDSPTLRGRIDFSRLTRQLPGNACLPIRYSPLALDNPLAQCIKALAVILNRITSSSTSRQAFIAVLNQMTHVRTVTPTAALMHSLSLSRYESHWTRSIAICMLLLRGQSPDPSFSGDTAAFSMLFPLQHLFERSLRRILTTALAGSGIAADHRNTPLYLLEDPESLDGILRLKPDYVITKGTKYVAVADAKWKRLTESERAYGIDRQDFYQISAYLSRYAVKRSVLLLPQAPWMSAGWTKTYRIPDTDTLVTLLGVDIESLVSNVGAVREAATVGFKEILLGALQG